MIDYTDAETYADGGQGGYEIRTLIAAAAAAGGKGHIDFYQPIPIFSTGCVIGRSEIA